MNEILTEWKSTFSNLFPEKIEKSKTPVYDLEIKSNNLPIAPTILNKVAQPKVFMPLFPGTNSEYDSIKAFEKKEQKLKLACLRI